MKVLFDNGVTEISTLDIDNVNVGPYLRNTMASDKNFNREMALEDIYRVMRPGEPPTTEAAAALFDSLFLTKRNMTFQLWDGLNLICVLISTQTQCGYLGRMTLLL